MNPPPPPSRWFVAEMQSNDFPWLSTSNAQWRCRVWDFSNARFKEVSGDMFKWKYSSNIYGYKKKPTKNIM